MRTVYKYPLLPGRTQLSLPVGSKPLAAQTQRNLYERGEHPFLWVELDTDEVYLLSVTFECIGTGHEVPQGAIYIDTFQMPEDGLVWHVYQTFPRYELV